MARRKQSRVESPVVDPDEDRQDRPGPETAGQAGDTQGLSGVPLANSQSVEELVEEGQFFEAAVVSGVENAPDPDVSEIQTHEVPEDDVPPEYLEQDKP